MKYIDGDIPIFENDDMSDLNIYSEKMASAIKKRVDKFGNPLIYKGSVDVVENLPQDSEAGWIYNVTNENKNYIFNGTDWIIYSDNFDVSSLATLEDLNELAPSKVIKYFGSIMFQTGISGQKVSIRIPLKDGALNFPEIKIKVFSNFNEINYAGFLEKSYSLMMNNKKILTRGEKYNTILNNIPIGITMSEAVVAENNLIMRIAMRTSKLTNVKIVMEGYYFDNNSKECLENATLSEIYTNDTVYPEPVVANTEITTGQEFKTGRIIDGKIEYGKRINCGALPNATEKQVDLGLNVKTVKIHDYQGMARQSRNGACKKLPYVNITNINYGVQVDIWETNKINITTKNNWSAYDTSYIDVFYTKN